MRHRLSYVVAAAVFAALATIAAAQSPLLPIFSYQGRLEDGNGPLNGTVDLSFRLYDALSGGSPVSSPQDYLGVPVNDGLFTVNLPFGGDVFNGDARWLQVTVNGQVLSPRQIITAAPYALQTRGMFYNEGQDFIGVGREDRITFNEVFGLYRPGADFGGMYVETDTNGQPFYGYSQNGNVDAYHFYDGSDDQWKLQVGFAQALTINTDGDVGIGEPTPTYPLHVEGNSNFLVFGHNFQTSGSTITGFIDGAFGYGINGVANGTSSKAVRGIANGTDAWAGYFEGDAYVRDFLAVGTTVPRALLHVKDSLNGTANVDNHVAIIENTSTGTSPDVLAVKINSSDLTPGGAMNFISFFNDAEDNLGSIQGDGAGSIELAGAGNDYAEWLPHRDEGASFEPGDVVGVFGGTISKSTDGADQIMVISTQPIVTGNRPREDDDGLPGWDKVAFIGQAPVKVRGSVSIGDFLIPTGAQDGTAVAIAPEAITAAQLALVMGTAWEPAFSEGVNLVNAAIGIDQAAAATRTISALQSGHERQQSEIDALRAEMAELKSIVQELASDEGASR